MDKNYIDQLRVKAENFVDVGRLEQAEIIYREILSLNNMDTDANYMLGVLKAEMADINEAVAFLNKAIELSPDYPDSYFVLAKIQQAKEEYLSAFKNCLKATSLDEEFGDAWSLLCALSTWLKDNVKSINSCKHALHYFPRSIQLYSNLARAFFNEHEYNEAAEYYKKLITLDPGNIFAYKYYCLSLLRSKEFSQVIKVSDKALVIDPDNVEILNIICEAYLALGNIDAAKTICLNAFQISTTDVNTYINMGNALQKNHQYEDAIEWYEKALKIEPDNANVYHNLGISYFRLNDNVRAADKFRKAIEIRPDLSISKHMLAVAEGDNTERAESGYVTDLFDEYAHRYDKHQKDLKYKVPEHINNAVRNLYADNYLKNKVDILDLGCGTGLCAPYLEDIISSILGVDLSPDMIKQASNLGLYSELVVEDMSACMNSRPDSFDLAISGDVFIYVGDLSREFKAAKTALRDNAYFVFTVQVNDDVLEYELTDTGRYNHAGSYIQYLSDSHDFKMISKDDIISRVDYGVPINSRLYVLQNSK